VEAGNVGHYFDFCRVKPQKFGVADYVVGVEVVVVKGEKIADVMQSCCVPQKLPLGRAHVVEPDLFCAVKQLQS
jgi:hypothetical protein